MKLLSAFLIGSTFAEDVCFDEIGCFTNDFPWSVTGSRPSRLPDSPDKIGTEFRLYATDSKKYEVLSLGSDEFLSSTFKKDADTIFLIHGWQSDGDQNWPMGAVDNFMDFYPEMNTITVDWRGGSKLLDYPQSASNTQVVGRQVAILARKLIESGLLESGANIKIAGHSLGGQIAGYAGKYFQTITGGEKLAQITGLDPAGPMFQLPDLIMNGPDINKIHIWKNDADFVDIIHTTAGYSLTNGKWIKI
jgi:pimeloyl-ACP methyl ester carboxylesterase